MQNKGYYDFQGHSRSSRESLSAPRPPVAVTAKQPALWPAKQLGKRER